MADDVEEKDDEDWSEAMTEVPNVKTSNNNSVLEVSSKTSRPQLPVDSDVHILQSIPKVDENMEDTILLQVNNTVLEKVEGNDDKNAGTPNLQKLPRSECRTRSRNIRQCQRHIQEMIGKHETRNEELEQQEGNLRQRLQTLECSMPAVMVWNICRLAQGAPTSAIRRLVEKQFQGYGADDMTVPTTPSQHWDARVRKIESERKEALRRAQEARALLTEKEAAVHERRKQLEEAKKCNQERKEKMKKLAREAEELRKAVKNARGDDNSYETGECGEIRCKEKWRDGVGSVSSIGSTDLECFAKLQELAEAEICMKRQITELERREEAYMRTLQQADEMWSKMEGDSADTVSGLQDQLEMKTAANQKLADRICQLEDELESLKKKLINSKDALSKFTSKEYHDRKVGFDGGEVEVKDRAILAAVKTATKSAIAAPETLDQESMEYPDTMNEESSTVAPEYSDVGLSAFPKMLHKSSEAMPTADQIHQGVDPVTELKIEASVGDEEVPEYSDVGLSAFPESLNKSSEAMEVAEQIHRGVDPVIGVGVEASVGDEEVPEYSDVGLSAFPESLNKSSEAMEVAEQIHRGVDPVTGLGVEASVGNDEVHEYKDEGLSAFPASLNKSSEAIDVAEKIHQGVDPVTELGVEPSVGDEEVHEYKDEGLNASPASLHKSSEAMEAADQIHRGVDPVTGLGVGASMGNEEVHEYKDEGLSAFPALLHKSSEAMEAADQIHRGADPVTGLGIEEGVGDEKDIPERWKNWNWDEGCPPDITCDGTVESSTGTGDVLSKGVPTTESKVRTVPEMVEQAVGGQFVADGPIRRADVTDRTNDPLTVTKVTGTAMEATETVLESNQIVLSREELRNWYNIVDSVHHIIAKREDGSSKTEDVALLAEQMKLHLRIKSIADVKGPIIMEESLRDQLIASEVNMPELRTPSTGEIQDRREQETKPADLIDRPDETESFIPEDVVKIDDRVTPEVTEDVEIPVGTPESADFSVRPALSDTETKSPEMLDKIADAVKSEADLKQPAIADQEMPIRIDELLLIDKISKEGIPKIEAKIKKGPLEISSEGIWTRGSIESSEKLKDMLPTSENIEMESEDLTEKPPAVVDEKMPVSIVELPPVEKNSKNEISDLTAKVQVKEEPADVPPKDSWTEASIGSSKKSEDMLSTPKNIEVDSRDVMKKQPAVADKKMSEISDLPTEVQIEEEPADISSEDSWAEATTESFKKSEDMLPTPKTVEVNSRDLTENQTAVADKNMSEISELPAVVQMKAEPADISSEDSWTEAPLESSKKSKDMLPTPKKIEVDSGDLTEEHVEENSKDDIFDHLTDVKMKEEPPEMPYDDSFSEPPLAKLEDTIPISLEIQDESGELTESSEKLSPVESRYTSAVDLLVDETEDRADIKQETTQIQGVDTSIEIPKESAEEAEEVIPVSKEDQPEFEDLPEPLEKPLEFLSEQDDIKSHLESDLPVDDDATIEGTPSSFVTPRTPPLSKIDVRPEIKDKILSIPDLKDELQPVSDAIHKRLSSANIVDKELEALLSKIGDVPEETEQMPDLDSQVPDPVKYKELEPEKVLVRKVLDDEEVPTIIDAELSPEPEAAISEAQEDDVKTDSRTKVKIPEAGSHLDAKEIEQPADKLAEEIYTEGEIITLPDRAVVGKPYLAVAKVESLEKLELSKSVAPCICKPHTCPLLDQSTIRQPKRNLLRVGTEKTQTAPPVPKTLQGRMDKQKLTTISESTRPSPEVGIWRRATVCPRRPKDKSTLTTVCVDTQTDSALIRGRVTLEGITRKDDCTCSGACPRKTEHGGCIQRISNRPPCEKQPAPVSRAVAKLFGPPKSQMSMTSSAEKEIAVVKYTDVSLVPQDSELHCVECRRPMTPEGTTKTTLPTSSKSQKSVVSSLKNVTSSTSRVTYKKDDFTCCERKSSEKLKTASGSRSKRQNKKDLDKRICDQDVCCPCPSDISKKTSSKSSKKKRKPEKKDQAVMANISRSTVKGFSKETSGIHVNKTKSPIIAASKTKYTDMKVVSKVSSQSKESYCECDESSNDPSIAGGAFVSDKTLKVKVSCDCYLSESVSKGSNCNCTLDAD